VLLAFVNLVRRCGTILSCSAGKKAALCGSPLSKWSGDAGPFCVAVEEAALFSTSLQGFAALPLQEWAASPNFQR
jgi:hypothetical protein